jgi:hypothetical protein
MYTEAIVALVLGTVAVLLAPALILTGSGLAKIKRHRTAERR